MMNKKMAREIIMITGGAGFIGSHVCDVLLSKNKFVICVDNFDNYYNPKIKEENIKNCLKNENFKLYRVDITNYKELRKIFLSHKIDKVIHLAARAGVRPSIKNPFIYEKVNVEGTLNLLELAKEFKVKNFIFGSSSSVYGINKKVPFSESDKTSKQISPYAVTKKAGELLCHAYSHLYSLPIICLRFFTVYGPRGRPDMAIYKFTKLISENKEIEMFGDGNSQRDYTYITDIINGIISALDKEFKFEIINLGNSKTVKLKYLISLIEKELNKKAKIKQLPVPKGDVPITYADISKAKKLLNYNPKVKIDQGIKRFVKWYLKKRLSE